MQLRGAEKFVALQRSIYGPLFAEEHSEAFPVFKSVLEQAEIFRIERPETEWTVDQVVRVILSK